MRSSATTPSMPSTGMSIGEALAGPAAASAPPLPPSSRASASQRSLHGVPLSGGGLACRRVRPPARREGWPRAKLAGPPVARVWLNAPRHSDPAWRGRREFEEDIPLRGKPARPTVMSRFGSGPLRKQMGATVASPSGRTEPSSGRGRKLRAPFAACSRATRHGLGPDAAWPGLAMRLVPTARRSKVVQFRPDPGRPERS